MRVNNCTLPWASLSSKAAVNNHPFSSIQAAAAVLRSHLSDYRLERNQAVLLGVSPGPLHVAARWAIWQRGGVIVPVFDRSPAHQLSDHLKRTNAKLVIAENNHASLLGVANDAQIQAIEVKEEMFRQSNSLSNPEIVQVQPDDPAQFLFTSGTTGRPKIVCQTHGNIAAQISSIASAWKISACDHVLHCLPLNHIHGIINALECPLWNGARVTMLSRFHADTVWQTFLCDSSLNVFMAVPTMYAKLIDSFDRMNYAEQMQCRKACRRFRVMISGSAALPESILKKWEDISGHILLERYGMSETGMILSNPLEGHRKLGYVGKPMPGVQVKTEDGENGKELLVKGPGVFPYYVNDEISTGEAFDSEGYFRTGDIVIRDQEDDYKIVGRSKTDILKTAGFKVSCLEIEQVLFEHSDVVDCAVVGLPSATYGDIIAALVQIKNDSSVSAFAMKSWLSTRLPPYKLPRRIRFVSAVPKNSMGKNDKATIKILLSAGP